MAKPAIESKPPESSKGSPQWMTTYADLMTLLMCFFVLMLSFSEMKVHKFKILSGSMKEAFGVQAEIDVRSIPKGTSVITKEFSPGKPDPTAIDTIMQFTVENSKSSLNVGRGLDLKQSKANRLAKQQALKLKEKLSKEIKEGTVYVHHDGSNVILQILERDSFASGSAMLHNDFIPTLTKIGGLLTDVPGAITVSGHTDPVPIRTVLYRSNWDLSAARAGSVIEILRKAGVKNERILLEGYADTLPRVPNDTAANRALNRRIEITVIVNQQTHESSWTYKSDDESGKAQDTQQQ